MEPDKNNLIAARVRREVMFSYVTLFKGAVIPSPVWGVPHGPASGGGGGTPGQDGCTP